MLFQLKNSVWMDARDLTGKIDTEVLEKNYAAQTSEKQEPGRPSYILYQLYKFGGKNSSLQ